MTTPTYLGSGDVSSHRQDYSPDWLANLADDVTARMVVKEALHVVAAAR